MGLVRVGAADEIFVLEVGAGREDERGCPEEGSSNGSWDTI